MRHLKYLLVLPLALAFISVAQAKTAQVKDLPLNSTRLVEGEKIQADYHFSIHDIIVCGEMTGSKSASVEWTYKGVTYKKMLPAILKSDGRYQGEWADAGGKLLFTNEHGHEDIFVTCKYVNFDA
jgi:hypothetical protein